MKFYLYGAEANTIYVNVFLILVNFHMNNV